MSIPTTTSDTLAKNDDRENIRFAGKDAALRADVHALGGMIGEMLLEQGGEALYRTVESARQLAIARREGDAQAGEKLHALLGRMSATAARDIVRAFSTYFQVVNTAEQVHRIRRRRDYLKGTDTRQPRALNTTVFELRDAGFDAGDILQLFEKVYIEPVFTPHPTETTRRTILRKHQNIVRRMIDMQNPALTPQEMQTCLNSIRADITAIWQTEESPTTRTTVYDELEHMLFFLTDVIYRMIPTFYEALRAAFSEAFDGNTRYSIPNVLGFASRIGGDASTDPDMSARVVRETMSRQRSLILDLYYKECRGLAEKLSQSISRIDVDSIINDRIEEYSRQFPQMRGSTLQRHRNMPYRMFLRLICQRLQATYDDRAFPYESAEQFAGDLQLIANSLSRRKGAHAGLFAVERLIRRVQTFGFHFLSLDIRYNASDLQEAVGYCLGEINWMQKPASVRAQRLAEVLRVNDSPVVEPNNDAKRLLSVFRVLTFCRRRYGQRAIGKFLVRHCRDIDDILAVLLLGRWSGMHGGDGAVALDIAPAFETGEELRDAARLLRDLLNNDIYKAHVSKRGSQTVMLSASGVRGDGGAAASRWNMQRAHTDLAELFEAAGMDYTLFHGRGSFSGRGGVADSIACGHLRATEQGDSVNDRYGIAGIAFRTLEKAFNAVVTSTAGLEAAAAPRAEWPAAMELIAARGNEALHELEGDVAAFDNYFQLATPIDVIERMRVLHGSLAGTDDAIARREDLPWAFAWAQSRFVLPSWYGFGAGLDAAIERYGLDSIRTMMNNWPFFGRLLKDVETAVAIADLGIARQYSQLAGAALHERFFPAIEKEYARCVAAVLSLRQQDILLADNNTLRRSIRLRNPYVDPMSLLQVELLRRWRSSDQSDDALLVALIASVNGISRGLQTSG